jgi:hypothetical protein
MEKTVISGLFKFGEKEHMEQLFFHGHLYMNTLPYFSTTEENIVKADKYEGLSYSQQPQKAKLAIKINNQFKQIPRIIEPIRWLSEDNDNLNLFCMYALLESQALKLIDNRNLNFGDTFIAFLDGQEFINRIKKKLDENGFQFWMGLVEYIDPKTYDGPMGPFRKYSNFSFQSEYRIVVKTNLRIPYSLNIGSLSDIAVMGTLANLNKSLVIE